VFLTLSIRDPLSDFSDRFVRNIPECTTFLGPPLAHHVLTVLGGGTEKQVVRPDTRWIVATMANEKTLIEISKGHAVREPMRLGSAPLIDTETSVALSVSRTEPRPALTRLVDHLPEANRNRNSGVNARHVGVDSTTSPTANLPPRRGALRLLTAAPLLAESRQLGPGPAQLGATVGPARDYGAGDVAPPF
jgi:hypothetical protein